MGGGCGCCCCWVCCSVDPASYASCMAGGRGCQGKQLPCCEHGSQGAGGESDAASLYLNMGEPNWLNPLPVDRTDNYWGRMEERHSGSWDSRTEEGRQERRLWENTVLLQARKSTRRVSASCLIHRRHGRQQQRNIVRPGSVNQGLSLSPLDHLHLQHCLKAHAVLRERYFAHRLQYRHRNFSTSAVLDSRRSVVREIGVECCVAIAGPQL